MDINQFIARRELLWQRLTFLTDKAGKNTLASLSTHEVDEFFSLYRMASSDLNLIQTRGGSSALLDYLETLVARAYQHVAIPQRVRFFAGWWGLLRYDFPAAARKQWVILLLSAAIMFSGAISAYFITAEQPQAALTFVPAEFFRQSPAQRVAERIKRQTSSSFHYSSRKNLLFSVYLFTHNIEVAVFTFALGATFGIGTFVMLFFNGAILGALGQRYVASNVGVYFVSWVGPHGVLELPAICVAAAAGMIIARAMWTRGGEYGGIWLSVQAQKSQIVYLLAGSAHMLVLAGIIEGGFSQITQPVIPYFLKILFACVLFAALLAYLFVMPIKKPNQPQDDFEQFAQAPQLQSKSTFQLTAVHQA